jgi:hypothetical protein
LHSLNVNLNSLKPMPYTEQIIQIHPAAPAKVAEGQPCNGCGVCCLAEPCPLGMLLSTRRTGTCVALRWVDTAQHYRCGVVLDAREAVQAALPASMAWAARWMALPLQPLARRWISAGSGCDSNLQFTSRLNDNAAHD